MNAPAYAHQMKRERSASPFIPYVGMITPDTIITKNGDYVRILKVEGITHETTDSADIQVRMDNLNTLIRAISSDQLALWTHLVRRQTSDRLEADFPSAFCQRLNDHYFDTFVGDRMMVNELYLALVYRTAPSKVGRVFAKSAPRSAEEIKADRADHLYKFDSITLQVEKALRPYDTERLETYEARRYDRLGSLSTFQCSRALEFIEFLLTGEWKQVRIPRTPLYDYLNNAYIHVGTEVIEIRTPTKTRFAQCLDFKDYPIQTEPGLINDLLYEPIEFVITQSFSCLSKREGLTRLERQANQLSTTGDAAQSQIGAMGIALNDLQAGVFSMGEYHYSLMVFGDTVKAVRNNMAAIMAVVGEMGFISALVNIATDAAFFAQLPGNWRYRPRVALLTSLNFAGLSSFHNFLTGKRDRNPWGQCVTILKTQSNQPLYFNFHASKNEEDSQNKKVLANTRMIGKAGTGKTTLMGFLFCQAQKYGMTSEFTNVFFDKDCGGEIMIRAIGGKYNAVKNGVPTGWNPFQLEGNEANITFLNDLVQWLATGGEPANKLSVTDIERINKAIRSVMKMDRNIRRLALVPQNMTEPLDAASRENSVKKRLARWVNDGALAWVFDNPVDTLDFTTHANYGFDGTQFLDNKQVCTPITMYLLYRQKQNVDGRRFINWWDEVWKWVANDYIADYIADTQLTIRKQDGFNVFATQMPSSLLESKAAAELTQQVATEIYLPNPSADYAEYTTGKGGHRGFGLSDAEFNIVQHFAEDSRMFLVKQGHRSAIGKLDLDGLDDLLIVLSGSTNSVELLHQIMDDVGEEPAVWLPILFSQTLASKYIDMYKRTLTEYGAEPKQWIPVFVERAYCRIKPELTREAMTDMLYEVLATGRDEPKDWIPEYLRRVFRGKPLPYPAPSDVQPVIDSLSDTLDANKRVAIA